MPGMGGDGDDNMTIRTDIRRDILADMTDARFPDRWLLDRRVMGLSPEAFKCFVAAMAWSVSNRTDGLIAPPDLVYVHCCPDVVTGELVTVGLWKPVPGGWLIVDFAATQSTKAQIESAEHARIEARAADADRKRKRRQQMKSGGTSAADTQDRQGQDRPGAVDGGTTHLSAVTSQVSAPSSSWPPVNVPGGSHA